MKREEEEEEEEEKVKRADHDRRRRVGHFFVNEEKFSLLDRTFNILVEERK